MSKPKYKKGRLITSLDELVKQPVIWYQFGISFGQRLVLKFPGEFYLQSNSGEAYIYCRTHRRR